MAIIVVLSVTATGSFANKKSSLISDSAGLGNYDSRSGSIQPTAQQRAAVRALRANATWNEFGTPSSLFSFRGQLAEVAASSAVAAARKWVDSNRLLFRLDSARSLRLVSASPLTGSRGRVILFRQRAGEFKLAEGGLLTIGAMRSSSSAWKIVYASSSITGDTTITGSVQLTPAQAWLRAAADVGRAASAADIGKAKTDRAWSVFAVRGFSELQRARLVAVPTPNNGVRPAWETLLATNDKGFSVSYQHYIDAATGEVLIR